VGADALVVTVSCVCEGVAKGPTRQREARENTNGAGQKNHRYKQMHEFLVLGAEGMVPWHGDAPRDFEYSWLKKSNLKK